MWYLHTLYYLQMCRARDDAKKKWEEERRKKKQEKLDKSLKPGNDRQRQMADARAGISFRK